MKIELAFIKTMCDEYKNDWTIETAGRPEDKVADTLIDKKETAEVLKKFYKFYYTNGNDRTRSILLITNAGTVIENNGNEQNIGGVFINGEDQCLGDREDTWAWALGDIKTTSDFLAQLAVFCNFNAK